MNSRKGFSIIEVIISTGIMAMFVAAFAILVTQATIISQTNISAVRGEMYARELIEVAKDFEVSGATSDWNTLAAGTCSSPCHPAISGNVWTLAAGEETIENYTRSLTVEDVRRDQLSFPNTIVETGGEDDPNTKKVIANVSWTAKGNTQTISLETYVYNE